MKLLKNFIIFSILCSATLSFAVKNAKTVANQNISVSQFMDEVHDRIHKWNWDASFFVKDGWLEHGKSVFGRPLIYWTCGNPKSENTSLILANVHGDEITPVYFGFRVVEWIKARPNLCEKSFVIVAPLVNPDGFLRYTVGTRTNYNKVDLNRNFDTPEWPTSAQKIWKEKYGSQRRYFPGDTAASEPEVIFQKWLIDEFHPKKILSVHAPLNHLDFDGPLNGPSSPEVQKLSKEYIDSCKFLKEELDKTGSGLKFVAFGTFPGSLGNYAGRLRGIPTITTELPTIDYKMAPVYFSQMENAIKVFINYELKDNPKSLAKTN